jgi:hypothetical protein
MKPSIDLLTELRSSSAVDVIAAAKRRLTF